MHTQKPIILLTGFLGTGKTTLLNAILSAKPKTRFAIVENEIGEIGIDGDLIIKNTDSFTELSNGCICCSLNGNFTDTLRQLSKRDDWDEMIIEATGVANPGGIISPFKQLPWTQKYFELPQVICLVDAEQLEEQLEVSDTIASQLAYADKVYINKTDLVDTEQINRVKSLISRFNPFVSVISGNKNNIPLNQLLEKQKMLRPVIQISTPVVQADLKEVSNHDQFEAIALEYEEGFDENKLYQRLLAFLLVQAANVYRFKGIFYDPKSEHKMIIQSVMKSLYIETGEAWGQDEKRISKFVFIGKNLQEKGYDKMLRTCIK